MKTTKKKTVFKRGISFLLSLLMVFTGIMAGAGGKLTAHAEEPENTETTALENLVVFTDEEEGVNFISYFNIPDIEDKYKEKEGANYKVAENAGYYVSVKKDGKELQKSDKFYSYSTSSSQKYSKGYDEETNEYKILISTFVPQEYNAENQIRLAIKNDEGEDLLTEGKYTFSLCNDKGEAIIEKEVVLDKFVITSGEESLTLFYSSEYCEDTSVNMALDAFLNTVATKKEIPTAIKVGNKELEILDYKHNVLLKSIKNTSSEKNGAVITGKVVLEEIKITPPEDISWDKDNVGAVTGKITDSGAYAIYIYKYDESKKDYSYYVETGLGDITTAPAKSDTDSYAVWYDKDTKTFSDGWIKAMLLESGKYIFGIAYSPSTDHLSYAPSVWIDGKDAIDIDYSKLDKLSQPENPRWGSGDKSFVASWDKVDGAYWYVVRLINTKTGIYNFVPTKELSVDLSKYIANQTSTDYRFQVQALSEDLSKKGHSKYSDLSEIAGLSEAAEKAAEDIVTLVPENGDVATVAKAEEGDTLTDDQKTAVTNAATQVIESAGTESGKTALSDAMKTEETQEAIDTISKAYGVVNNITVEEATVSDNVAISADDKNKIEIIGAELSGEKDDKLSINISSASADPKIDTGVYKSVLAFDMKLQKGDGATKTEVTDLKVPVTVKLPVPENMNALNLYILHFKSDGSFDKIYPAFDKAEDGTMLAVFTLTHFSTFAFVEEKAEESGDSGSSDPSGNSGDSGESGGSSSDSGQSGGTTPPLPLPAGSGSGSGSGDGNESGSETGDSEDTDDSGKQDEDAGKEDKDDEGKKDDEEKDPAETGETKNVLSIDEEKNEAVVYDPVSEGGKSTVNLQVIKSGKVYRMYDGREHFYTKVDDERSFLLDNYFKEEVQDGFEVISADEEGAVPVFRFYNKNNGGMHFFTTNEKEAKWLIEQGWGYEGIAFYAYEKGSEKGTPQYRLLNPNSLNGEHNWTSSKEERDWLVAQGWQDEGFSWNIK